MSFGHDEANYWLSGLFALLLVVPVVFGDQTRGLTRRALAARPLIVVGVVSYGVYLYHTPLLAWIVPFVAGHPRAWLGGTAVPGLFIGTLALTVPAAILSYRFVESPFLRRRYTGRERRKLRAPRWRRVARNVPADQDA
jgi:peptidoglycan/LPS O-acetylase OafA/YrhL